MAAGTVPPKNDAATVQTKVRQNVKKVTDPDGWITPARPKPTAEGPKEHPTKPPAWPKPTAEGPKEHPTKPPVEGGSRPLVNNDGTFGEVVRSLQEKIDIQERLKGVHLPEKLALLTALPTSVTMDPKFMVELYKRDLEKSEKLTTQDAELAKLVDQLAVFIAANKKESSGSCSSSKPKAGNTRGKSLIMKKDKKGKILWDQSDSESEEE